MKKTFDRWRALAAWQLLNMATAVAPASYRNRIAAMGCQLALDIVTAKLRDRSQGNVSH